MEKTFNFHFQSTSLSGHHAKLVPAFPHSLWLTFYKTDISLRRGHMDSAGPPQRESSLLYFAELFVVVLDGKVHEPARISGP